ncbi:MAG: transketolase, partial [Frankiales bacterium]|nr:transketolase [Frankiales bacterium]
YAAYGWHVQEVDWLAADGAYEENVGALHDAFVAARAVTDKPSFIALRTIIGWPAPNKQGTGKAHGSALGADEVAATKTVMGMDPAKKFDVPAELLEHAREVVGRGQALHREWQTGLDAWAVANPEGLALLNRMSQRRLPEGWESALPVFEPSDKGIATRAASGKVLSAIAPVLAELWGGSADLAESNNTTPEGQPSFLPENRQSKAFQGGPYGRVLHFGIREHAMGAILNGIALHGGTRPYGGTFLTFSDYMRGAVRLAAIMKLPVTYVWTHDSIGLGEDGPTHQPIEHLAALRAIVGLDVVRPADANETAVAWRTILEHTDRPAGLILSRQNLPIVDRSVFASAEGVAKGGYVLADASAGTPEAIIIATGSEVPIALAARELLEQQGTPTRVVSMPCVEWFLAQEPAYRQQVLPPEVKVRASVEAAVTMGWREFVGDHGEMLGLDHYGASAPAAILFEQFGLTPDRVVAAVRSSISKIGATKGSTTGN